MLQRFNFADSEDKKIEKLNALVDMLNGTSGATIAASALPIATDTTLGVVKEGTGVTIAADGTISAP